MQCRCMDLKKVKAQFRNKHKNNKGFIFYLFFNIVHFKILFSDITSVRFGLSRWGVFKENPVVIKR